MLTLCRPRFEASNAIHHMTWLLFIALACLTVIANGMTDGEIAALKYAAQYIILYEYSSMLTPHS